MHESSPSIENRTVKRTARNTINQIDWEHYSGFETLIKQLKSEGNTIIGIEVTDESIYLQNFDFTTSEKIVLLLGSERHGIQNVSFVDSVISIPMYGRNSSMNVIHSLAITLYEATKQLNKITSD
jgi:tRNA G18 (ribose-2'-O)-methylase SpoU